jgi:hypothetical protein
MVQDISRCQQTDMACGCADADQTALQEFVNLLISFEVRRHPTNTPSSYCSLSLRRGHRVSCRLLTIQSSSPAGGMPTSRRCSGRLCWLRRMRSAAQLSRRPGGSCHRQPESAAAGRHATSSGDSSRQRTADAAAVASSSGSSADHLSPGAAWARSCKRTSTAQCCHGLIICKQIRQNLQMQTVIHCRAACGLGGPRGLGRRLAGGALWCPAAALRPGAQPCSTQPGSCSGIHCQQAACR